MVARAEEKSSGGAFTTDFDRMIARAPAGLAQVVPFFPGYLGSPSGFYPGFSLPVLDVSFQPMVAHPARSHARRHSSESASVSL